MAIDEHLPDERALQAWTNSHAKFVSAADSSKRNRGRDVFPFWQDGPWALTEDSSYAYAWDEARLKQLSARFGEVFSFVVESTSGTALFWYFENGTLRRSIERSDTDFKAKGEPLPEENGIDTDDLYMNEVEELWKAFGISPLDRSGITGGFQAICVVDQTDYSGVFEGSPFAPKKRRPWWKFW